jgi:hypothetical protein
MPTLASGASRRLKGGADRKSRLGLAGDEAGAERAEEAGQRRQMADFDLLGLGWTMDGSPSVEAPAKAALAFNNVRRL